MRYALLDFKRVIKRKSTIFTILFFLAMVVLINYLVFRTLNFNNFNLDSMDAIPIAMSAYLSAIASPIVSMVIAMFVVTDEYKERGYLRPVEAGYSRTSIVVSKLFVSIALSISFLVITYLVHLLTVFILYSGISNESLKLILIMVKYLIINIPQILFYISVALLIYNLIKNDYMASILGYLICILAKKILNMMGNYLNLPWILQLTKYFPSSTSNRISDLFCIEVITKIPSFDFIGNYISGSFPNMSIKDLLPGLAVSLILFTILFSINIMVFRKKNLD